jgi:Uma2 family endonuclease
MPVSARPGMARDHLLHRRWHPVRLLQGDGFGRVGLRSGLIVAHNPDSVLGPDVQVFSAKRPPNNPKGWPSVPPVLVAEVVDGPADHHHIMSKVPLYLAFGVDLVWIVRPQFKDVQIHRLAEQQIPFDRWLWINRDAAYFTHRQEDDILDGGDVLPSFSCQVADLFA